MLRASSQGLGVVCVRRRTCLLSRESTIAQCRIKRWIASASLLFGHDVQTVKGKICDRRDVQSVQCNEDQEMVEPTFSAALQCIRLSASPNPHTHDAESSSPACQKLAQQCLHTEKGLDTFPEHLPISYSSDGSRLSSIKRIRRRGQNSIVGIGRENVLHAETDIAGVATTRDGLLGVLESTVSAPEAWDAYTTLCNMIPDNHDIASKPFIPFAHLHRLCRLLSSNRPKTHLQFLRLLSALNFIRSTGGRIHLHEWNAIVDHAGRGWRKARPEDWENALSFTMT